MALLSQRLLCDFHLGLLSTACPHSATRQGAIHRAGDKDNDEEVLQHGSA